MIQRHECSMFNRIKACINAHLNSRIRSCMYSTLDSSSVAFVYCCVQFFLRKFRYMGTMRGKHFHPLRTVTHLFADLFSHFPRTIYLFHFLPGMSAGHTDSGIRMCNLRNCDKSLFCSQLQILTYSVCRGHISHRSNSPFKCCLCMLKCIEHDQLRSIIKAVRLRIPVSQMCMHIAQSRKDCRIPIIFYFFFRKFFQQFFL